MNNGNALKYCALVVLVCLSFILLFSGIKTIASEDTRSVSENCFFSVQRNLAIPTLQWPLRTPKPSYLVYYKFGVEWPSSDTCKKYHVGIDIKAAVGDDVLAAESGIVKIVYDAGKEWKKGIVIEHNINGQVFTTTYIHLKENGGIFSGKSVRKGDVIATIEDITPKSNHLHFGVRIGRYETPVCERGGLPQSEAEKKKCTKYTNEMVFPGGFVDPWSLSYEEKQSASGVTITPANVNLEPGQKTILVAKVFDQNGKEMQADISWSASCGSLNKYRGSSVEYTAPASEARCTITASALGKSATATILVAKKLKVLWPNGGEILKSNNNYKIRWSINGSTNGKIDLYYHNPSNNNWVLIVNNLPPSTTNYNWKVPYGNFKSMIYVGLNENKKYTSSDTSDNFFNIIK